MRTAAGEDLYVTLLAHDPASGEVTLHVFVNPLVAWIWIGGGVVALGAVFAAWPDRRRSPSSVTAAAAAGTAPAPAGATRREP